MVKLLVVIIALAVLYKLFINDKGQKKTDEKKLRDKKVANGEMVKDPICGCYVDVENAISVRDGDVKYHFCSYDCRQKFLDSLERSGREIPPLNQDDE